MAYYTPKAIVQYMARQSLLHYLQTHLGEHGELTLLLNEKDFTRLGKNGFVHQNAKRIAELLDEVKICDPAIGSGAFPIGLLQEILWTRLAMNMELNTPEERAKLKRRIIQNSIHGVDIDPGAIEIARLRFWLALVVDEDQPRPLPNLDYKIHRADSLVEYIRGEPIRLDKVPPNNTRFVAARSHLVDGKHKLFAAQTITQKREARFALYRALSELGEEVFTWMRLEADFTDGSRLAELDATAKEFHHWLLLIDKASKQSAKLQDQILDRMRAWFDDETKPTFLWHLHFGEVFQRGGFDIVIANPPYVRHETISSYAPLLRDRFQVAASRADLLIFFYEQAVNLLRVGGALTFITSNKYFRAGYGSKLRPFLTSKLSIQRLIDFGDTQVFEAIAYASILLAIKSPPEAAHAISACTWPSSALLNQLGSILDERSFPILQSNLDPGGWSLESRSSLKLLAKMRSVGTSLFEYTGRQVHYGIKTGLNEAFVIDEKTRAKLIAEDNRSGELIKPFLRGKDVKRWKVEPKEFFLIAYPFGFHKELPKFPAILRHLKRFETELKARGQCTSSRNGDETGQHHWLELDNNPKLSFLQCFERPKIVIPAIERRCSFALDDYGHYTNDKTSIVVSRDAAFLCAVLNSSALWWIIRQVAASKQHGYFEFKPMYIRPLPIPPATAAEKANLGKLAETCTVCAKSGNEDGLRALEAEIDTIVYRLFGLESDEIALIETTLAPTREFERSTLLRRNPSLYEIDTSSAAGIRSSKLAEESVDESPWLPGELFNLEGELPPAKKPRRLIRPPRLLRLKIHSSVPLLPTPSKAHHEALPRRMT